MAGSIVSQVSSLSLVLAVLLVMVIGFLCIFLLAVGCRYLTQHRMLPAARSKYQN